MKRLGSAFVVVALLAAPAAVVATSYRVADRLGTELGRAAATYTTWLKPAKPAPLVSVDLPPVPEPPRETPSESLADKASAKARPKRGLRPAPGVVRGVRVSAGQVLALAERGAVPSAVPVAASKLHPAGLRLVGVSGLGVGMRDGDVLSHVSGTPVSSVSTVTGLVIRARSQLAREISAEFWREGARWQLVVEQPYAVPTAQLSTPAAQNSRAP